MQHPEISTLSSPFNPLRIPPTCQKSWPVCLFIFYAVVQVKVVKQLLSCNFFLFLFKKQSNHFLPAKIFWRLFISANLILSQCYETILSGQVTFTRRHCKCRHALSVYLTTNLYYHIQLFIDIERENITPPPTTWYAPGFKVQHFCINQTDSTYVFS